MFFAVSAALGIMVLGLLALAASTVGGLGLRVLGLVLLVAGGVMAGVLRAHRERHDGDGEALAQLAIACEELERNNPTAAGWAASKAVNVATTPMTRNRALTVLAWAALGQGYPERAKAALDKVEPSHYLDVHCLAAVEAARGRTQFAIQALEVARTAGALSCDAAKLLVDCHLRAFGIEDAVAVATQMRKTLGRENCELVVNAARLAGAHAAAASLAAVLRNESGTKGVSRPGQATTIDPATVRHG